MWNFASSSVAGTLGSKNDLVRPSENPNECSDDEICSNVSREEGLECPICWESFNIVENVPYVLWCGHTLCKNCVLGLQWAVLKLPTLPLQVPLFVSCPWCNLLSLRLVYKGDLKYPRKNFFLLWMVESLNGDRSKSDSGFGDRQTWAVNPRIPAPVDHAGPLIHRRGSRAHPPQQQQQPETHHNGDIINDYLNPENLRLTICKTLAFFAHLAAKFPLVIVFLLFVLYVIPASAVILAVYILISVVVALPSFLILYFAYPFLDWLVREILN
uniref:RING-type domain-containing protein n=1 Tax=Kalanchoe fedtschenkoi TaxID=63787 RepID=A0A7N0VE64_KALFE